MKTAGSVFLVVVEETLWPPNPVEVVEELLWRILLRESSGKLMWSSNFSSQTTMAAQS